MAAYNKWERFGVRTMNTWVLRIFVVLVGCATWCWGSSLAIAQIRRSTGVRFSGPGNLSSVGRGQNWDFRNSAAGGGGLQATGGGYQTRGVLSSSMNNMSRSGRALQMSVTARGSRGTALSGSLARSAGSLTRTLGSGGGSVVGRPALGTARKGVRLQDTSSFALQRVEGAKGMARAMLRQNTSLQSARGFISAIGETRSLVESDEAIKTLVPDQPGQYRDKMNRGEELLRAGDFMPAYKQFKVASDIVGRAPEPFVNMAHAQFGAGGYGMTAVYIRRALTYMPDLPRLPLRPKHFYENVAIFGDLLMRLETHVEQIHGDGDALLVLAYFQWFTDTPNIPTVQSALEKALAATESEDRIEAIQIFWRAIVATGKASGKLETAAAAKPPGTGVSTTQPADQAAKATETPVRPAETSNATGKRVR